MVPGTELYYVSLSCWRRHSWCPPRAPLLTTVPSSPLHKCCSNQLMPETMSGDLPLADGCTFPKDAWAVIPPPQGGQCFSHTGVPFPQGGVTLKCDLCSRAFSLPQSSLQLDFI